MLKNASFSALNEIQLLLAEFKMQCFLHTTLPLSSDDAKDADLRFEARTQEGKLLLEAFVNSETPTPCVTLRCVGETGEVTLNASDLITLITCTKEMLKTYIYEAKKCEGEFSTITLNVPDWFADPEFQAWLDRADQRCFTYHRHGDQIGEYSDVLVLVDGFEGDADDLPAVYWRQIVQAANAYRARGVRLTNLEE